MPYTKDAYIYRNHPIYQNMFVKSITSQSHPTPPLSSVQLLLITINITPKIKFLNDSPTINILSHGKPYCTSIYPHVSPPIILFSDHLQCVGFRSKARWKNRHHICHV